MEDSSLSAATSTQSATITNATLSIIDLAGSEVKEKTKRGRKRRRDFIIYSILFQSERQ